ncbi:hypothetical protein COY43_00695 [Candidatus Berkelbacteria bacterium CG_4_10_14_0_8_um_filter_35_9_33_8]|uniref:ATP-dependent helicase n=1 Tax=Candidatus Berkelbacteria bacterium CG_4_10_14_0_2_um_filter_35_9_33_12 TaxID=1974499 RepID=A0A2M7W3H5_9BACT|nr:MAG: hypothetical protein COX10_02715 [Candidatus Berkelbacteria bacterium CG23_combo_of_CG06-09_8_20_14_all_33_15]PIS08671.1 MAG: hypothetical protein COT76_00145 [Candidatus Berkelbacteria bacterium CG10_big_fil_rev_8_21_14_0_10_33_10]PIZ28385.1 MAG: hypothetical protein COY43_00695 [Candidatus Berkelbacteria bacterium CG_4_10_14_0_8_um_filter_35_9_33_8]PJA20059.1 MAG: hypothetical protein COX60_02980 [Candidatus Berkelbacteria bacterium CG_4_10_14_0_2_um_filter_35_9_33_12]
MSGFILTYKSYKKSYSKGFDNNSRFQNNRGKRNFVNPGSKIDINRFINRAKNLISEEIYQSKHKFSDFEINSILKQNILSKNYSSPTPIQDQIIPFVLQHRDVIGIANTGTGKTAAFLIPLINKVILNKQEKIIIMVPTRELALQIQSELYSFGRNLNLKSVLCIGGTNINLQIRDLRNNSSFIIGTPGRLKDLIKRKVLYLGNVNNVVLDEADRMLDMGFIHDMKAILSLMPTPRQTLLFSATLSPKIEQITKQFQSNPIKVSVKTRETLAHVDQNIVKVTDHNHKVETLHNLLNQPEFEKVLVFGKTKYGVEKLSNELKDRGFKSTAIHGNKRQAARQKALNQFKKNEVKILVATDVAARGLDIPHVSHVINFDVPASYEDYIHRIGRTGRAGNPGKALTFVR